MALDNVDAKIPLEKSSVESLINDAVLASERMQGKEPLKARGRAILELDNIRREHGYTPLFDLERSKFDLTAAREMFMADKDDRGIGVEVGLYVVVAEAALQAFEAEIIDEDQLVEPFSDEIGHGSLNEVIGIAGSAIDKKREIIEESPAAKAIFESQLARLAIAHNLSLAKDPNNVTPEEINTVQTRMLDGLGKIAQIRTISRFA